MSKKSNRKSRTPTSKLPTSDKYEFYQSYFGFFEEDENFIAIRKIDYKQLGDSFGKLPGIHAPPKPWKSGQFIYKLFEKDPEEIRNMCKGEDLFNAISSLGFDKEVAHKVVEGLMKNKKILLNVQSGAAIEPAGIIEGSFKLSSPECPKNEDSILITTQSLEELKNLNKESI